MLLRAFSTNLLVKTAPEVVKPPNLNEICIWDADSGQLIGHIPEAHPAQITSILSVEEDIWSAAEDGSIKSWNVQSKNSSSVSTLDDESKNFSGFLLKKALNRFSQHWQRRWFVLRGNTLTRYKTQNSNEPKETIELKGAIARPNKRKFCIALVVKSSSKRKNEGSEMLVSAPSQEEYDMWLEKLQANTEDSSGQPKKKDLIKPDLVGDMSCGFGAIKCMAIVDSRVWAGTRGGITAWNISEQRYTGAIKLQKNNTINMKGGDDLETQYVSAIITHQKYVWCVIGSSIVRIDPKTRQMIDWFDGHTSFIDDIVLIGDYLWTCSSSDRTMRLWSTLVSPNRSTGQIAYKKAGSVFENYEGEVLGLVVDTLWIGGADGTIRTWDPTTKSVVKTLEKKHTGEITDIAVTGKTVWVTGVDGTISVWLVS